MSILLEKYKNKRRLGKGAYGDVLLVEDPEGRQFAIKMISKKIIRKDPYLQQYLEGEKQCMMSVKSQYIMDLIGVEQDDNYIYFICQYCDGGDLLNYQAKQPNKVFTMKQTTKILSEVILGLKLLHSMGYLHRDIKPQNILLKKGKNETNEFKLADFGFAKKSEDVGGTVLGTEHYMSPEIYSNQVYGFEVDMWAFGVVMYFMLNMEFPFKINPHLSIEQKREQLIKQALAFSYADSVKKSKKKILDNCTNETEDLFKRIFDPNGNSRINFFQIREHPLFKQYFPIMDHQSKLMYFGKNKKNTDKYRQFVQYKESKIQFQPKSKPVEQPLDIPPSYCLKRFKTTQQKQIVELEIERLKFLYQIQEQLTINLPFMDPSELIAFRYNILKYYVILFREYNNQLRPQIYEKKYSNLKWRQFFKTNEFNVLKRGVKQQIDQAQIKVSQTYDQCRNSLNAIRKYNPKIELILEPEISQKYFEGQFKDSYRCSTSGVYAKVREKFSTGNRYVYLTLLVIMCHSFNQINNAEQDQLRELFRDFVAQSKSQTKILDFTQLRSWLSRSEKQKLKNVMINILKKYFS